MCGEPAVAVPSDASHASVGDAVRLERGALTQGAFGLQLLQHQELALVHAAVGVLALVALYGAHHARDHVLLHELVGRLVPDSEDSQVRGRDGGVVDEAKLDRGVEWEDVGILIHVLHGDTLLLPEG